jgi:hypothetical protein
MTANARSGRIVTAVMCFRAGPGRETEAAEAWAFELTYYFMRRAGEQPAVTYAGGVYTVTGLMTTSHPFDTGGTVTFSGEPASLDFCVSPARREYLRGLYCGPEFGLPRAVAGPAVVPVAVAGDERDPDDVAAPVPPQPQSQHACPPRVMPSPARHEGRRQRSSQVHSPVPIEAMKSAASRSPKHRLQRTWEHATRAAAAVWSAWQIATASATRAAASA